jgi:uncharacterized protein (TIGR02246 family)
MPGTPYKSPNSRERLLLVMVAVAGHIGLRRSPSMSKRVTAALLCVLATANMAVAQLHRKGAGHPAASTDVTARFLEAFKRGDAAAVAALYTEDATLMPPNTAAVKGRAAIKSYWREAMEQGMSDVSLTPVDSSLCGNIGYETLSYELSVGPADKKTHEKGKAVTVLKRDKAGQWRIADDIWNSDAAPAAQ